MCLHKQFEQEVVKRQVSRPLERLIRGEFRDQEDLEDFAEILFLESVRCHHDLTQQSRDEFFLKQSMRNQFKRLQEKNKHWVDENFCLTELGKEKFNL